MATFEGKKYEVTAGNLRHATSEEANTLQVILDLKTKMKLIQEEIAKRCQSLPQNVGLVAKTTYNGETKHSTFVAGRPKWVHYPIPECNIERHNTTIPDKKALQIND